MIRVTFWIPNKSSAGDASINRSDGFIRITDVGKPIHLIKYLGQIEKCLKLKAKVVNLPLQMGDIVKTHGSTEKIKKFYKYKPETNYKDGIKNFIDWYKAYFKY